jgi:hypothetical protein
MLFSETFLILTKTRSLWRREKIDDKIPVICSMVPPEVVSSSSWLTPRRFENWSGSAPSSPLCHAPPRHAAHFATDSPDF